MPGEGDVMEGYRAQVEALAKKLGGGWRMEHGVMPLVVLTLPEAQRIEARLDSEAGAVDLLEQAVDLIAQPSIPDHARKRWQTAVDELLGDGTAAGGR